MRETAAPGSMCRRDSASGMEIPSMVYGAARRMEAHGAHFVRCWG